MPHSSYLFPKFSAKKAGLTIPPKHLAEKRTCPVMLGQCYPNIIGNTSDSTKVLDLISATGAITNRRADKPNFSSYGGGGGSYAFGFNASLSNGLYGKSSTVQTSALQTLIIIKT